MIEPHFASEKLIALAVILQTVELLQLRKTFADEGVWRWPTLKEELQVFPPWARACFGALLPYRRFLAVLTVRLAAGGALLCGPGSFAAPLLLILLLSTILIALRWRGTFNGGSDSMTAIVLVALFAARCFPESAAVAAGSLLYVALQTSLSYFIAGWVKLKNSQWRNGAALLRYIRTPGYGAPKAIVELLSRARAALAASWGIIVFECAFPLGLFSQTLAPLFIGAALAFHIANVFVFGLNRFLFAWAASYPAYYWAAGYLSGTL